ncbi:MAG: beta-N-acetylhexosaminidase [Bacteroidales bacterium]|nr:beta-N-acetylhexosaminidase [Bacteroidales bacterium]
MMKLYLSYIPLLLLLVSCNKQQPQTGLANVPLIPLPDEIVQGEGAFHVGERTSVVLHSAKPELKNTARQLSTFLSEFTGREVSVTEGKKIFQRNTINLKILTDDSMDEEGYQLMISRKKAELIASSPEGLYRGVQTIRQMSLLCDPGEILLPAGRITDHPEYEYRGAMLDVSRHFFPPEAVKDYIDLLSLYKINMLHLHLSDDQGWRIEIKSWPKLTETGGITEVGGGEGGFYTQEEYTDLVKYAAERYITIVPEIDMPGHTNAALASYAELNCDGKATELYTGTKVGFSTLCTDKEVTYQFVDDVVREISALTPGPYFHVGGDESHVTELPDYNYFINRVKKIVESHGKTMIGWDEISHADLTGSDIAQYWASSENAARAIEKGARLILSPAKYCYLDMKYDSSTVLGLNWAAYIEVDDAYAWKPLELSEEIGRKDILGIESPLWAETIETLDDIEYLAFPRLIGHAEIGWSRPEVLDWEDYRNRLASHGQYLDRLGVNFYRSELVDWE